MLNWSWGCSINQDKSIDRKVSLLTEFAITTFLLQKIHLIHKILLPRCLFPNSSETAGRILMIFCVRVGQRISHHVFFIFRNIKAGPSLNFLFYSFNKFFVFIFYVPSFKNTYNPLPSYYQPLFLFVNYKLSFFWQDVLLLICHNLE